MAFTRWPTLATAPSPYMVPGPPFTSSNSTASGASSWLRARSKPKAERPVAVIRRIDGTDNLRVYLSEVGWLCRLDVEQASTPTAERRDMQD